MKAFGYTNGQLNGTLLVMKRSELEKHRDEDWGQDYSSINLMEGVRTRAGTYVFDEGGGSSDLYPHGYQEDSCSQCLDEVVVVACRYCHTQNDYSYSLQFIRQTCSPVQASNKLMIL